MPPCWLHSFKISTLEGHMTENQTEKSMEKRLEADRDLAQDPDEKCDSSEWHLFLGRDPFAPKP